MNAKRRDRRKIKASEFEFMPTSILQKAALAAGLANGRDKKGLLGSADKEAGCKKKREGDGGEIREQNSLI